MASLGLPPPFDSVDDLLESGDVEGAEAALSKIEEKSPIKDVLRVKVALMAQSIPAGAAMQRLIALMRQDAHIPGAQALYKEASKLSYEEGASSMAHSHPPPPVEGGDPE